MTDKITLTKKQFENWAMRTKANIVPEDWESLVLESQKKEPIERWLIEQDNGYVFLSAFNSREEAEKASKVCNGRIVHLREVESG